MLSHHCFSVLRLWYVMPSLIQPTLPSPAWALLSIIRVSAALLIFLSSKHCRGMLQKSPGEGTRSPGSTLTLPRTLWPWASHILLLSLSFHFYNMRAFGWWPQSSFPERNSLNLGLIYTDGIQPILGLMPCLVLYKYQRRFRKSWFIS